MKRLTVRKLREWLEAQPKGTTFMPSNGRQCPIAMYVDEDHWVYPHYIGLHDPDGGEPCRHKGDPGRIELPAWAKEFISRVDHNTLPITRDRALAILKEVTPKGQRA